MSPRISMTTLVALLLLSASLARTADLQPILATTSNDFVGYDGRWSAISIRVGLPEQWLSVLPNTLSQETWVIGPGGCDGTTTCQNARGGLFYSNESSTFQDYGFYQLSSNPDLAASQIGYYGLDTIVLNDNIAAPEQIVASINTTDSLLGQLGLGVQQTRLNGSENVLPFLSSLVQNETAIPSHSYGYTAGASYRLKGVPASLTLGGIDANRFTPNDMSFTLGSAYAPIVAINSISVSSGVDELPPNWSTNPTGLMGAPEAASFTIDTSTPFLWLPESVCDKFAETLNLTYNDTLQLYFHDDSSSPEILRSWDLTFNFSIGNLPGSENIHLSLPYGSLNLQLSYPYPELDADFSAPPTDYFPLRRAANNSEYIIGRAFLQETYLTVDYERNSFSLSQAVFTEEAVNNVALYAITRPSDSIFAGPNSSKSSKSSKSSLSTGVKAGIGVGVGIGVVLVSLLIWFCLFQRKTAAKSEKPSEKAKKRSILSRLTRPSGSHTIVSELLGDKRQPTEVPADTTTSRFELAGSAPLEMPGPEVSPSFFQDRDGQTGLTLGNDPRRPAELEYDMTTSKEAEAATAAAGSDRSASPVPPYSPAGMNQRHRNSMSPNSVRHSQAFGTLSSGEAGISPVGNNSGSSPYSRGNSGIVSSPVSPQDTMPSFNRAPRYSTSNSRSVHSSTGPFLTPNTLGRAPSRSTSRSSRFREEGLSTTSISERSQTPQPSSSNSARFSWE